MQPCHSVRDWHTLGTGRCCLFLRPTLWRGRLGLVNLGLFVFKFKQACYRSITLVVWALCGQYCHYFKSGKDLLVEAQVHFCGCNSVSSADLQLFKIMRRDFHTRLSVPKGQDSYMSTYTTVCFQCLSKY